MPWCGPIVKFGTFKIGDPYLVRSRTFARPRVKKKQRGVTEYRPFSHTQLFRILLRGQAPDSGEYLEDLSVKFNQVAIADRIWTLAQLHMKESGWHTQPTHFKIWATADAGNRSGRCGVWARALGRRLQVRLNSVGRGESARMDQLDRTTKQWK